MIQTISWLAGYQCNHPVFLNLVFTVEGELSSRDVFSREKRRGEEEFGREDETFGGNLQKERKPSYAKQDDRQIQRQSDREVRNLQEERKPHAKQNVHGSASYDSPQWHGCLFLVLKVFFYQLS